MIKRLLALVVYLLAGIQLYAQFDSASVLGTVYDSSGAVVTQVKVSLTNQATEITVETVTNETGKFNFAPVRVGMYSIRAEHAGFSPATATDVRVDVGARKRMDLNLQPSQATESVEVIAEPMLLETESSQR